MTAVLIDDLRRAGQCVALLESLGAHVVDLYVRRHRGATIRLHEAPGALLDHLDARAIPIICGHRAEMAVIDECLVHWPLVR
jgi:predicted HD phosphohydrolase